MAATKRQPLTRAQREAAERRLLREHDPRLLRLANGADIESRPSRGDEQALTDAVRASEAEALHQAETDYAAEIHKLQQQLDVVIALARKHHFANYKQCDTARRSLRQLLSTHPISR